MGILITLLLVGIAVLVIVTCLRRKMQSDLQLQRVVIRDEQGNPMRNGDIEVGVSGAEGSRLTTPGGFVR